MRRKNLLFVFFLVLVLSLSLFAVACDGGKNPSESTTEGTANATESGTAGGTTEPESTGATTEADTSSNVPEADSTLTVEEAIALGESMANNKYTEDKYYVTGTLKGVFSKSKGNMTVIDKNGNTINVYGAMNEDGTVKFADMAEVPVAGDTITVYGVIGQSNGTDSQVAGEGGLVKDQRGNDAGEDAQRVERDHHKAHMISFSTPGTTDTTEAPKGTENTEAPTGTETAEVSTDSNECEHVWGDWAYDSDKHWKECDACGDVQQSGEHVADLKYSADADGHWIACKECGVRLESGEHTETLKNVDGKTHSTVCDVCEYVKSTDKHTFVAATKGELHECICGEKQACPAQDTEYKYSDREHWNIACARPGAWRIFGGIMS